MGVADRWNVTANVFMADASLADPAIVPVITRQPSNPSQVMIRATGGVSVGATATVTGVAVGGGGIVEVVNLFVGEYSTARVFASVSSISVSGVSQAVEVYAVNPGGDTTPTWVQSHTDLKLFKADHVRDSKWGKSRIVASQETGRTFWTAAPDNIGTWVPKAGHILVDSEGETHTIQHVISARGRGGSGTSVPVHHYQMNSIRKEGALK